MDTKINIQTLFVFVSVSTIRKLIRIW